MKQILTICAYLVVFTLISAAGPTTATDAVSLSFSGAGGSGGFGGGTALLGLSGSAHSTVQLEASESGSALRPGARFETTVDGDAADGSRLHYSVHGQSGTMKITVRALTPVEADSLSVQVVSAPNTSGGEGALGSAAPAIFLEETEKVLISGIGDCYTGTASVDGPLLRYGLQGDPGFEIGDVDIEYKLIPEGE